MIQIIEPGDLIGKIIERTGYVENKFFVFFADQTFCIFSGCGYGDNDVELNDDTYNLTPSDYNHKELFELGLITEAQFNDYRSDLYKRDRKRTRENEIEALKELKKKYPNI
jgi:hypothetical protein